MTDANRTTKRVVFVGMPGEIEEQIASALSTEANFELVDFFSAADRLARDISASDADIIIVDHQVDNMQGLDVIDDLALQFVRAAIIAILPDDDPVLIQQVILAGAKAFLVNPFTQTNLITTLNRVSVLEDARSRQQRISSVSDQEDRQDLRIVTVYSPKGGVGCSTVAINLALAHYEKTGERVLLMDGKLFFGHLDVVLNIRSKNSLSDLLPHANNLDEGLVHDVVYKHASGIHVLLGPNNINTAQGIHADTLFAVLMTLKRLYDFIVIDAGNTITENTVTLMDVADRVMLVATPDLVSLHEAGNFIQFSQTLSYPNDKMLMVLNRANLKGGITLADVETALHRQVFGQIPDDEPMVMRSVNRGVPIMIRYPRSPISKAFLGITEKLIALQQNDMAPIGFKN